MQRGFYAILVPGAPVPKGLVSMNGAVNQVSIQQLLNQNHELRELRGAGEGTLYCIYCSELAPIDEWNTAILGEGVEQ